MLSPKMQRSVRVNEAQLLMLSDRAQYDHSMIPNNIRMTTLSKQHGYLHKRTSDSNKWQLRWFILYQNLLFYYENEASQRPSGIIFLEGCYCDRFLSAPSCINSLSASSGQGSKVSKEDKLQHCFCISFRRENQRQYELRANTESECSAWISSIREASFNKLLLQKEELEQKHVHLLQVVESEKTAKWQYTQHCEELASEIKKLRAEICALRKECKTSVSSTPARRESFAIVCEPPPCDENTNLQGLCSQVQDSVELRKIKKVQSFFRGWLCRRRWKQIVEEYIKSPHAESMRKRNHLVFSMVEAEEEYMEQLEILVSCFLRPFRMAASSKRPPCTHEDVNSIFLNSETVLFLHQIFLKGLTSRLESWPTLVLGDLFDMLLPMLSIYQEYVRNHHYSLQVLTECKSNPNFATVLKRLEAKPTCQGRSLETFLTYPMHQIPRYIITLHELLAHTPHDHVERKSLQNARQQLEDLSRQMHDEVSETENLRKNLSVERMIVEGCDILLDVNQVFVRQGSLVQVPPGKGRIRSRLASFKSERETVRQCFLFSNHLIIGTRTSGGRLHLLPDVGKIPLADATLIEDPSDSEKEDDGDGSSCLSANDSVNNNPNHRDFKILIDTKSGARHCVHLIAATVQDKEAWISDISQCLDNIHLHSMFSPGLIGSSGGSIVHHHALRADPRLFKDDVDIRFSRTLNSCKLPQVRYATPERLLQRLTDLRFLSIDFLNTFLLTYRVFTDGETVLNALKKVFYDPPVDQQCDCDQQGDFLDIPGSFDGGYSLRRTSGASSVSGYCSEGADRDRSCSTDSSFMRIRYRKLVHQQMGHHNSFSSHHHHHDNDHLTWIPEQTASSIIVQDHSNNTIQLDNKNLITSPKNNDKFIITATTTTTNLSNNNKDTNTKNNVDGLLSVPATTIAASGSSDTLTENTLSGPSSPSNLSSHTLVGSTGSGGSGGSGGNDKIDDTSISPSFDQQQHFKYTQTTAPTSPLPERINIPIVRQYHQQQRKMSEKENIVPIKITTATATSAATTTTTGFALVNPITSNISSTSTSTTTDRNTLFNVPIPPNQQKHSQQQQKPKQQQQQQQQQPHRQSLPTVTTTLCCENQGNVGKILSPLSPGSSSSNSGGGGGGNNNNNNNPGGGGGGGRNNNNSNNGNRNISLSSTSILTTNNQNDNITSPSSLLLLNNKSPPLTHQQQQQQGNNNNNTSSGLTTSISPPKMNLLIDRRPSAGANVIPHAALCQHRHSLQINGDGGVCRQNVQGIDRNSSPRVSHRNIKTPEKQKKNSFCSPQREPPRRFSESDDEMSSSIYTTPRGSLGGASLGTISSRASMQHDPGTHCPSKVGVVITSYRQSHRRSSTSTAAAAFAIATSASSNPRDEPPEIEAKNRKESVVSSPATMRVLNVLRHWVSKHFQDFEQDAVLRSQAIAFLDDITCSPNLLPSEHRAASQLLRLLCRDDLDSNVHKLDIILTPPTISSKESIETLSALEIAEQMTYLDHQIFLAIRSEEFLGQAWMKADKKERAEHIILMTKRFNDGSRLVSSEIISRTNMSSRVAAIEKWTAVADICRCLHNFNGVLQICAAFTNAAVYRLKKTWDKVPKTIKQTITKLQAVVCSDGRFRAMREALHRCDPPCIPYLGMYLTDLSFIEEGTPDFTPDGLLNFSKMRMIAHVIREIRHFQQTPYKIDHIPKVTGYLLDTSLLLDDDDLYCRSLQIEPRSSRLSAPNTQAV